MSKARSTRSKKQAEIPQQSDQEIKAESNDNSNNKIKLTDENVTEKRVLRPKRSYSSLPKNEPSVPTAKTNNRKRKNSSDKVSAKKPEEQNTESKKSDQKIPVLFEDSPDENQENQPAKKTSHKAKNRKTTNNKLKKSESASNLSISATATAIVNSVNSCSSSINDQTAPKSIMKSKQNKSQETEESKKPKRGVRIHDDFVKSEILGVKCDKHKYSASTSTPSGLRRKPLKAPQDVSMICKPESEVNTTS